MEEKNTYKTIDDVRESFLKKLNELNIDGGLHEPLLTVLMEENRQAWIRGKEYGWSKAWKWRLKKEKQAA